MTRSKAWIALTAAALALPVLTGCKKDPEPVSAVPPPPPSYEPQPLPPVEVQPGPTSGGPTAGYDDGGAIEPQPLPPSGGSPATAGGQTYTVKKGDTLWSIARNVYGNGQKWVDIAQANPSVDPQKLAVGQKLVLP